MIRERQKKPIREYAMALAYIGAFMMYMIVLLYGVQVMSGVFEEKNNRIVEVIISSVKPVQLMMGKIIGIALVGLTQFVIWIVLMAAIAIGVQKVFLPQDSYPAAQRCFTEHNGTIS